MKKDKSYWPKKAKIIDPELEAKTVLMHKIKKEINENKFDCIDPLRYSKWSKLVFAVATLKKFVKWIVDKKGVDKNYTLDDIREAEIWLIRKVQYETFKHEYDLLKNKECITSGNLKNLNPILGEDKLIRLSGRLNNANVLKFDAKYPIILPSGHIPINKTRPASLRFSFISSDGSEEQP